MSERTNLNAGESPVKYIVGSVLLLILSGAGIFWQVQNKNNSAKKIAETIQVATPTKIAATPTEALVLAKEGEVCGAGPKGIIKCESGLKCNESKNKVDDDDLTATKVGSGGICEKATEIVAGAEVATATATPTVAKPTPTITTATATPSAETMTNYENKDDGFSVAYNSFRKLYVENEPSGKRYIFYSYSGNITVHAGKTWSWINPGRIFTDKLLVGGEKSFIYEISNQKIVDVEKGDKKYTIQCVHNAKKDLKTECDKFLADFNFI